MWCILCEGLLVNDFIVWWRAIWLEMSMRCMKYFFYLWSCGMCQFFPFCEFVFLFVFEQPHWAFCLLDVHTFLSSLFDGKIWCDLTFILMVPAINATDFILRISVLFHCTAIKNWPSNKMCSFSHIPRAAVIQLGAANKQTILLSDSEKEEYKTSLLTKLWCTKLWLTKMLVALYYLHGSQPAWLRFLQIQSLIYP